MIRLTLTLVTLIICGCGGIQVDRSQLPGPAKRADWQQPGITTWKLENGLKVWYVPQSQAPLVAMNLVLPTGAATDPSGARGHHVFDGRYARRRRGGSRCAANLR